MPLTPAARRRALFLLAGVFLTLLLGAGVACYLSARRPGWWLELPKDNPVIRAQAEQVENGVVSELSLARPAEGTGPYRSREWALEISEAEANAWLTTRLKGWLENRGETWPGAVEGVQVSFRPGSMIVGVRLVQSGMDRVVSITGMPEVRSGAVWMRIDRMAVGGLPLPRSMVLDRLGSLVGGDAPTEVLEGVAGRRALLERPLLELDGGRHVRVMGVRAEAGRVVVTCRTEKD